MHSQVPKTQMLDVPGQSALWVQVEGPTQSSSPSGLAATTVGELPMGEWILRVEASEGAFWQAPVTSPAGSHTPLVFDGAPQS